MKLAEGNVQCPLFGCDLAQTIECEVDAFSNSDPGETSQQEGIGIQIVCTAQFLLQPLVVFRRQRPGEVFGDEPGSLRG